MTGVPRAGQESARRPRVDTRTSLRARATRTLSAMSESAEKGQLSGLARSIDALFAPPAAPRAKRLGTEAPPTPVVQSPTEAELSLDDALISPEPPAVHVPGLQDTMIGVTPSAKPGPRPREPEMFPSTQMLDVIKVDAPAEPQAPLAAVGGAPPATGPWEVEIERDDADAEPTADIPLVFPATSDVVTKAPTETARHGEAPREDSVAAFAEAVDALVAGDHAARERVERLAAALRERLVLDPLANAVERLVSAAGDPPDPWLLEVATSVM